MKHVVKICFFLVLAVVAVYWPVINYEFVKYDDNTYIEVNPSIKSGFTLQNIRWAFTSGYASNWHPVTWLSHTLDYQLFGTWAGGHHLVNVLFHIANTLLLFIILLRLTGTLWASAFAAALFGIHPLHVESVAWVAERKDVLSTLFWMLTILAYSHYGKRQKWTTYLLTLIFFILGIMAKPMVVTLPFVLLLLDYWPLERKISLGLLVEKIPFFAISAVSSVITFLVQRSGGSVSSIDTYSLKVRIGNSIISYIAYIWKMFWPTDLAVLYPHPRYNLPITKVTICAILLLLLTVCFIYFFRRRKYMTVGWLWYLGTLVPVIGMVQVGAQSMADRYTYIPLIGLFIIIAWAANDLLAKKPSLKIHTTIAGCVILLSLMAVASIQVRYWENNSTLFEHTLSVTKNNYIIHNNYANILSEQGNIPKAIEQFEAALKIRPNSAETQNNLGNFKVKIGKLDEAIQHYKLAIELKPNAPVSYYNMGLALAQKGNHDEAITAYQDTVQLDPNYIDAINMLASEMNKKGDTEQAIQYYKKSIKINPEDIIAHGQLGLILAKEGKFDEAMQEFRFVLKRQPKDAEMQYNLGFLLECKGQIADAIRQYQESLKINPDFPKAREQLSIALKKQTEKERKEKP